MLHRRSDRDELREVGAPFVTADLEPHADDAVPSELECHPGRGPRAANGCDRRTERVDRDDQGAPRAFVALALQSELDPQDSSAFLPRASLGPYPGEHAPSDLVQASGEVGVFEVSAPELWPVRLHRG